MLRDRDDLRTNGSRVERWLKRAYREIAYSYNFEEMNRTVEAGLAASVNEYTLASLGLSDLKHIRAIRDNNSDRKVNRADFRYIDRRSIGTGFPRYYVRYGDKILFDTFPTERIVLKIRYRKQITEPVFTSSNTLAPVTAPETPEEWDEVIQLLAVARGADALFEIDRANALRRRAKDLADSLPIDSDVDAEDDDFGIGVRYNMWGP
jgi:hypothetical protein